MKLTTFNISAISAVAGGFCCLVTKTLGGYDILLQSLIWCVVLDYVTGLVKAFRNKKLNSEIGAKGITKKVGYFVIVTLCVLLDRLAGNTGAIRAMAITFFIANEGLSIVENFGEMGVPLPNFLKNTLEQLRDNNDKGE